ncbi:MAG: phenylalanine--tRNA ligase subunit beta [Parcubacteria group bacterium]
MYISLNWLKQYIDLPEKITPEALALKLTMSTVEVEGLEALGKNLDKIVIGRVLKVEKHPNADKLILAKVDIGSKELSVVCGGSNVKEKMLVALAPEGAKVAWHGEGELVEIKKAKVRDLESEGMICASVEIGLGGTMPHADGEILDLSHLNAQAGTPLAEALNLNDIVFEIDNKSLTNRPDLWGHYGLAREVAGLYDLPLKKYATKKIKSANKINLKVKVQDAKACPRYLAVALSGIKVGESPAWLKQRVQAIGQKPINNIVDITNYIMFDIGQPLHAFDADKINNHEIIIRKALDKEKITTLDGTVKSLTADDLVIADNEKAVALAGVMGGANSEISAKTETIIIESANFEPVAIRRTANRLSSRTEASIRFEKSLDPNYAGQAILKAVELIKSVCPSATVASDLIDESNFKLNQALINISWQLIDERIGFKIEHERVEKILNSLGFKLKKNKTGLQIIAPTWRATKDIAIAEDIIEEITRIYGYDNLAPAMPSSQNEYVEQEKLFGLTRQTRNILAYAVGANEIYNYSFIGKDFLEKIEHPINHIEIANPFADSQTLMRASLIPGLLKNAADNLRFFETFNIFEIGKTFINDKKGELARPDSEFRLPTQDIMAAGLLIGKNNEDAFFRAKGTVETLFEKLNLEFQYEKLTEQTAWTHPEQSLAVLINNEIVGHLATLHPQASSSLGINVPIAVWELNLNKIEAYFPAPKKYRQLPKFPAVKLDLSIVVNESEQWKDILNLVKAIKPDLIKRAELLDVFKNGKIKAGDKSLTFRITYQSDDRTLEMSEINVLQKKIIEQLEKGVGARIRN